MRLSFARGGPPSDAALLNSPACRRWGLAATDASVRAIAALDLLERENAELKRKLAEAERLADRDPLSGVLNRRGFMRALAQVGAYAERYAVASAVLYIDLDGFKAVNDGYGHAAGDAVLRHVARLLVGQVRESDHVGRLGGDEFGLILAQATPEEARAKAVALGAVIAGTPCAYEGVMHALTAAIGVATFRGALHPETALARADEAMYAVKARAKAAA